MKITYHRSAPDAFYVNSFLAELEHSTVVVDTQFILPEAEKLLQAALAIGKPLGAILLTHPHPDHVNGTGVLLREWPGTPVYATQATRDAIVATAEPKRQQWKPILGNAYPDKVIAPTHLVGEGETIDIDGVGFTFTDVGALESINESIITVPTNNVAFVGDLFYHKVHPWLVEGRALAWRAALDRLHDSVSSLQTLYCGHGDPATPNALREQAVYMDRFFERVRTGKADGLSPDEIIAAVKQDYPGWPLEMLIGMNIEPVAAELAV